MKTWLIYIWDAFRSSLWFTPSLLTLGAILLSMVTTQLDWWYSDWISEYAPWMTSTPESARAAMSGLAGAMVTVAGVVFSVTVVALSMTSTQYGPRLLRSFMQHAATQFAFGTFLATSLYCLSILRLIRSDDPKFVPHLSVALGVLLAIFSVGVLIYFIRQMTRMIQAPYIIQAVGCDLDDTIARMYPPYDADAALTASRGDAALQLSALDDDFACVKSRVEGYVEVVDVEGLVRLAEQNGVVVQLEYRPGDFAIGGMPLARVWPSERNSQRLEKSLNESVIVGNRRTPRQDVGCAVTEMVEVAVRALSPGINDPISALTCIDRLAASLSRLAERGAPSPYRFAEHGRLRLLMRQIPFPLVLDTAFDQIREHSAGNVAVSLRLLKALSIIGERVRRDEDRQAVVRQAEMVDRACQELIREPLDREKTRRQFQAVRQSLGLGSEEKERKAADAAALRRGDTKSTSVRA